MVVYVHEDYIKGKIEEAAEPYKRNSGLHKKGEKKDPKTFKTYNQFYKKKYLPMKDRIEKMVFDDGDENTFKECADVLNQYWTDLKEFINKNGITKNTKLHTNFLEEFSCYFLSGINGIEEFDIYTAEVFAGLKIMPSHEIKQITKDVDFCIGNELVVHTENDLETTLRIPAISVEVKSYVDATMLGEVMNSARKIKGANPGSKVILLTWINSFADEHALEAAYDSSIDEIVVLSEEKRESGKETVIKFTEKGLRDYYCVIQQSLKEVMQEENVPAIGRILSYVRQFQGAEK